MEVADQLALLAQERKVRGVLVRWPGDLASAVSGGGDSRGSASRSAGSVSREFEEGAFHLCPPETTGDRTMDGIVYPTEAYGDDARSDGSVGYMRGRILHVLDKCTSHHGRAGTDAPSSGPLLAETARPFALFDTSITELEWIVRDREEVRRARGDGDDPSAKFPTRREDKYGNSLTEMDVWGRCPVYGNRPPLPHRGKYYFSSKEKRSGYRVSSHFVGVGNVDGDGGDGDDGGGKTTRSMKKVDIFDSLHDNDMAGMLSQCQGSLSAMHTLYDFADENLQGRIALPSWASSSTSSPKSSRAKLEEPGHQWTSKSSVLCQSDDIATPTTSSAAPSIRNLTIVDNGDSNRRKVSTALVQIPKRNKRGKGNQ